MEEKERTNGCDGKVKFRHGLAALTTMVNWIQRESLDLYLFSIYPCRNCRHWHIGRYYPGAMARGDAMESQEKWKENNPSKHNPISIKSKHAVLPHNNEQPFLFWASSSNRSWVYWNGDFDPR